jgi:hypothetical protein
VATLQSYGRALSQMAGESVSRSARGFVTGIKSAAMAEMPGLTSMYSILGDLKSRASKLDASQSASVKEQKVGNIISLEMVRQLKSISTNTLAQARLSANQAKIERHKLMFEEESEREKILRDKKLLDAIKKIGPASPQPKKEDSSLLRLLAQAGFFGAGVAGLGKVAGVAGMAGVAGGALLSKLLGRNNTVLLGQDGRPIKSLPGAVGGSGGRGGGRFFGGPPTGSVNLAPVLAGAGKMLSGVGVLFKGLLRFIPKIGIGILLYNLVTEIIGLFTGGYTPLESIEKSLLGPFPKVAERLQDEEVQKRLAHLAHHQIY